MVSGEPGIGKSALLAYAAASAGGHARALGARRRRGGLDPVRRPARAPALRGRARRRTPGTPGGSAAGGARARPGRERRAARDRRRDARRARLRSGGAAALRARRRRAVARSAVRRGDPLRSAAPAGRPRSDHRRASARTSPRRCPTRGCPSLVADRPRSRGVRGAAGPRARRSRPRRQCRATLPRDRRQPTRADRARRRGRDASRAASSRAPLPIATTVERAFAGRASRLSEMARRSLLVAAAASTGDLGVIARAADFLGVEIGALQEAEAAGLVTVSDGRVEFRHPLVRSAVHSAAKPAERRAAHAALAQSLTGEQHADEQRLASRRCRVRPGRGRRRRARPGGRAGSRARRLRGGLAYRGARRSTHRRR